MKKRFATRIPRGLSLLLAAAVATAPISAAGQDSRFMFRYTTGQVYGDLKADSVAIGDIYVGESFSHTLTTEGGKGNKTWNSTGAALPGGLSLNSSGTISGIPSADAVGTWGDLSFQARDELGQTVDVGPLSLRVLSPVAASASGGYAFVGENGDFLVIASGGLPPYSYSLVSGDLPDGMSLSGGSVTGTPTSKGIFDATIRVTDANGRSDDAEIGIIVREELVASADLPDGYVGEAYAGSLEAEGGDLPYTWELLPGYALPAGLSLGATTGVVSGIPLAPAIGHSFMAAVVDGTGDQDDVLTTEMSVYDLPAISQAPLPRATPGMPYSVALSATGGKPALQWDVAGGTLPAGLTLSAGGTLSGTPTASGRFTPTFMVTDANGRSASESFTLDVFDDLVASLPATLDTYTDQPFSFTATASGGLAPYTWSAAPLPGGLALSSAGVLSGTSTAAGTVNAVFNVEDSLGLTAAAPVSVRTYDPVAISSAGADPLYAGHPVTGSNFVATGGKPPLAWSVASGTLPSGVNLSAAGVLSGTPSAAGGGTVTVQVADANGRQQTQAVDLTVLSMPAVAATAIPEPYVGSAYSFDFTASGGKAGYTWTVSSGSVPAGLILASSGRLSGTPTAAGTSSFTVRVTDANGKTADRALTVMSYDAPAIAAATPADGYLTEEYTFTPSVSGGKAPLTWSLASMTLPGGLTLNASTGAIAGTPTIRGASAPNLRVTDANGRQTTRSFGMTMHALPDIANAMATNMTRNSFYNVMLYISGGKAPLTWSVASGSLPTGLSLNASTGVVSGTPTAAGSFNPTIRVTDANGKADTRSMPVTVAPDVIAVSLGAGGTPVTLESLFTTAEWTSSTPKVVTLPSGAVRGSSSATAAVSIGPTGWGGSLTFNVAGEIQGDGGAANGGAGGHAFNANRTGASGQKLTLNVTGAIRAGGGGGGKGGTGGTGGDGASIVREPVTGEVYGTRYPVWYYNPGTNKSHVSWDVNVYVLPVTGELTMLAGGNYTYYRGSLVGFDSVDNVYRYRVYRTSEGGQTNGGAGGAGGNGGQGQGYNVARATGVAGANGAAGGANAGAGGKGGTGGTGGTWGGNGAVGGTGATGADGNRTAGLAGAAGAAGGLAGYAIQGYTNVTKTGSGAVQGRL